MERPIKQFQGAPEVGGICRMTKEDLTRFAKKSVKTDLAKKHVPQVVGQMLAPNGMECVDAREKKFARYGCYSFDDIAVMLRYQENLLYSCEKWKQ
jgi:hypothetical protein